MFLREGHAVKTVIVCGGTLEGMDVINGGADQVFATGFIFNRSADRVFLRLSQRGYE